MVASLVLLCTHYSLVLDSDSLYHRLFAIPCMVEMLVREFVPPALAADLDFSGLQRVNTKFHIGRAEARRRESDVIWRLPTREGTDIYLYLLFEFQSRVDWWMAVRAQIYQGLLWQQVIDERKLKTGALLPPLLLVVLYNGQTSWNAPTQIRKLIALPRNSTLWFWQPQSRYYLLDMAAFPGDELARRRDLAALLFRLERPIAAEEVEGLLAQVKGWFHQHPDQERLQHLFAEVVRRALQVFGANVATSNDLLETKMRCNFETIAETWKQQALTQGRAEGIAQGIAEGMAQGVAQGIAKGIAKGKIQAKAESLVCLLVERFGALSPSRRARIQRARLPTLERWFKRAIAAPNLRSVFNSPR